MKKILLFVAVILFFLGCSNDFDLTEDWKDITVVYGLLDQSKDAQYIRIEKAFLDPTTSAITLAQISDSLYYNNISVELREIRPNSAGGSLYQLQRVNAEDEGITRVDGVFSTSPNYLYKLNEQINEDYTYRLVITKDDGSTIEAETKVCEDYSITSPFDTTVAIRFDAVNNQNTTFRWSSKPNTKFYNAKLLIDISEAPTSDPSAITTRTLVWKVSDNLKPNDNGLVSLGIPGVNFYTFIENELDPGYNRTLKSIRLQVGSGGEDLLKYVEIGQVNSGITGADIIPTYTNISGDSFGVFSSRYYKTFGKYIRFTQPTLDSLSRGYRTNNLGF